MAMRWRSASAYSADHALWPKVEEVAATILFLASPDNRVTRGAIVPGVWEVVIASPRSGPVRAAGAALPSRVMNSRRFMCFPRSRLFHVMVHVRFAPKPDK